MYQRHHRVVARTRSSAGRGNVDDGVTASADGTFLRKACNLLFSIEISKHHFLSNNDTPPSCSANAYSRRDGHGTQARTPRHISSVAASSSHPVTVSLRFEVRPPFEFFICMSWFVCCPKPSSTILFYVHTSMRPYFIIL